MGAFVRSGRSRQGEKGSAVERALESLYRAPPKDFTRTREAIARRLRAEGDDGGAKLVRARRKPTQIAWVLNELSRRDADGIAELVDEGRMLAREQRRALSGEETGAFRASVARQRAVVGKLTREAMALMKELGLEPSGHMDEIASALQAGLADASVGVALEQGRLERAPEPAATVGPVVRGRRTVRRVRSGKRRELAAARAKLRAAEQAANRQRRRADAARKAAQRLADDAAAKARAVEEAKARLAAAGG